MFDATTGVPGRERLGQDHAEALAEQRRRAEQVGLAEAAPELAVADPAERLDALGSNRVGQVAQDGRALGADDDELGVDVLDERGERREQDRQALALLGPPDEQQAQALRRRLRALRRGREVDAVGDHRVLAAEPAAARSRRRPAETAMRAAVWLSLRRIPARVATWLSSGFVE